MLATAGDGGRGAGWTRLRLTTIELKTLPGRGVGISLIGLPQSAVWHYQVSPRSNMAKTRDVG